MAQLQQAAAAVFRSWDAPKAVAYRRMNRLPDDAGTAVTVQMMVFGNAGGTSGAGVGFTRDPSTGAPSLYLDFCFNAQGEDVVAGRHTISDPQRLARLLPRCRRRTPGGARHAGDAVPRHAGFRVHRAGGPAVPAADPPRQTHPGGGVAYRGGPW